MDRRHQRPDVPGVERMDAIQVIVRLGVHRNPRFGAGAGRKRARRFTPIVEDVAPDGNAVGSLFGLLVFRSIERYRVAGFVTTVPRG